MHTQSVRAVSVLIVLAAGGLFLRAGEIVFPVSNQSLAAWKVSGDAPAPISDSTELMIPADTQLMRSFAAPRLVVSLATRPVFGGEADACPVLEVGPAALVFMRTGQVGRLVLVAGEAKPVLLSTPIMLDASGASAEVLKISLTVAEDSAAVTIGELSQDFPLEASSTASMDVVITAGHGAAWSLETMSVTVSTQDVSEQQGPSASGAAATESDFGVINRVAASVEEKKPVSAADLFTPTDRADSDRRGKAAMSTGGSLEVFTPPAVRHGRSDAARAAAFEAGKK